MDVKKGLDGEVLVLTGVDLPGMPLSSKPFSELEIQKHGGIPRIGKRMNEKPKKPLLKVGLRGHWKARRLLNILIRFANKNEN